MSKVCVTGLYILLFNILSYRSNILDFDFDKNVIIMSLLTFFSLKPHEVHDTYNMVSILAY